MNQSQNPLRDGLRDASETAPQKLSGCLVCGKPLTDSRSTYCSPAHRQQAYRLRQRASPTPDEPDLRRQLQRQRRLTAHTIYECSNCQERFVGERRCPDCHLFARAVGLGGHCPECEQLVLISYLLGEEV